MNLGKNVYNLLKRRTEVYVAGLGTFRRNHTPATYDEARNVYLPPITYIDFDARSDKGYDFVQYIQQVELLDRKGAEELVSVGVAEILAAIREGGQAKLDDLGYLVGYGEGFVFKPLDLSGFNYEVVEGLPKGVVVPPTVKQEPTVSASEDIDPESLAPVVPVSAAEPVQPVADEQAAESEKWMIGDLVMGDKKPTPRVEEEIPVTTGRIVLVICYALLAMALLGGLYYWSVNPEFFEGKKSAPVVIDTPVQPIDTTSQVVVPMDSLASDSLLTDLTAVDTLAQEVAEVKKEEEPLVPAHHHWQIVIGSHKTLAQAYEQAESYNKAGYPKVRVIPSNLAKNRKKVIWDSYETKEQADSALVFVQKRIIKDAWPDRVK